MQVNANTESFQAQYERLVENWLANFAQINQDVLKNLQLSVTNEQGEKQTLYGKNESGEKICDISPEQIHQMESGELKPDIQVVQSAEETEQRREERSRVQAEDVKVFAQDEMGESELVYGKAGSRMINRLRSEQIEQLREASTVEVGSKIESEPIKVKLGDEVVFQVDESGQVLVNDSVKLQQVLEALDEPIQEQQPQPIVEDYYDDDFDGVNFEEAQENVLVELVSDLVDSLPDPIQAESEPERDIQDELDEFFQVDLDESFPTTEEEVSGFDVSVTTEYEEVQTEKPSEKTGLDCIEEAVGQLKDGSLKTVLTQSTQELRVEVSEQEPNPQLKTERSRSLDQLMEARIQESQDPNWWQRTTSKIEEMVTQVRDTFVGSRAASTLKQFADKLDLQSGDSYEGAEYNLKREGKDYTLTDKEGAVLLKFRSSVMGVKVDASLPGLDDRDSKKIEGLRKDLQNGNQPQGAFVSEGKAEADYLKRVNSITSALSRYAAQNGGTAKVEGRFSYDWESSKGSVMIKNKQGEVLLASGQGHTRSRMTEKDLKHFEEMLPNLAGQRQGQAGQKKQMEVG
ncbi:MULTISPECIES: hypothetical protein [unclassified Coleofasciculus]|uniref:hypothetical protein n=1 Tax=unclassified Coleofasciculus TaxID=2692782 RepID=UPI0018809ABE|nr:MULTISPECIES: hypothetical protein [unclassified Coleofasciculus]MBE9128589.1 hypothetical protein [Coleofasciculus sp. LEGE 07081]MBE9150679.1 hypothetical protein [Coleofasciculus sp. LEGE 07092]